MAKYLAITKTLLIEFRAVKIEQVGRDLKSHTDALTSLASVFEGENGQPIAVDLISIPSYKINQEVVLSKTELGLSWMDPIVEFLRHDKLLEDKRKMHKL